MLQLKPDQEIIPYKKKGNFSLPMLFSIGLHLLLVGGLVYASTHSEPPKRIDNIDEGMSVVMLDLAGSTEPQEQAASEAVTEPESVPEPEVTPEPEVIPEPEPEPEPEIIPEPIQEPKIVIPEKKVEPKPKPKPKQKAKPVDKPTVKPVAAPSKTTGESTVTTKVGSGSSSSSGGKPLSRAKPAYPDRARAMGIEGKVKVKFDVDAAGKVQNIQIISESPKNMFARDVRRAMLRWRYESNKPTRNLETTFIFNLSGNVDIK
jgi:protein TonB